MAKPVKYPKKFRMKLEKVAEKREERQAAEAEAKDAGRIFDTLWHEFLPKGSVHLIRARMSDDQLKMTTNYQLFPEPEPDYVHTAPPWLPADTAETPDPE
jgi:hypothetical protein